MPQRHPTTRGSEAEKELTAGFTKFPRTPHLWWLGRGEPRGDKLLTPPEAAALLAGELVVEEKVDGANLGLSAVAGELRAQSRGHYLTRRAHPQFQPLWPWLEARRAPLLAALGEGLALYGEWCFAVHSVTYDALPDWFLLFDVLDRRQERFWSAARRDGLAADLGLATVPRLAEGKMTRRVLLALMGQSRVGSGPMEGVYLRQETADWLVARAKLVSPAFVNQIDEHWSKGALRTNRLAASTAAKLS